MHHHKNIIICTGPRMFILPYYLIVNRYLQVRFVVSISQPATTRIKRTKMDFFFHNIPCPHHLKNYTHLLIRLKIKFLENHTFKLNKTFV